MVGMECILPRLPYITVAPTPLHMGPPDRAELCKALLLLLLLLQLKLQLLQLLLSCCSCRCCSRLTQLPSLQNFSISGCAPFPGVCAP